MSERNWQSLMDEGREAFAKNRTVQAEQFFLQALKQATEAGDAEDNVAATLNNLAAVYHTQGKYQWAEERYKTALGIQERLCGKNSAPVATTVFNLAVLCSAKRRFEEAEQLYKRAMNIRETLFGENSPELVAVLRQYAELLKRLNRLDESARIQQRAVAIQAQGS